MYRTRKVENSKYPNDIHHECDCDPSSCTHGECNCSECATPCYKCGELTLLDCYREDERAYCSKCEEKIKHADTYGTGIHSWEARFVE